MLEPSEAIRRLNPDIYPPPKSLADRQAEYEAGQEKAFQADVEAYLRYKGFEPRTDKALDCGTPRAGWYYHHNKAEDNPYLLDLLVMPFDSPAFELELKAAKGRVRKRQRQILEQHPRGRLCVSMQDVRDAVREFTGSGEGI